MTQTSWNPEQPGQEVRMRNNPGKRGITTGTTRKYGGRLQVLINWGPNETSYKQYEQLELCGEPETNKSLMESGRFGTPDDLRRILTFEKVKGELTDVFYSMESSNTDFYAYQFKPVLKFLDSPVGRLLIADEVGLGKTIESVYIWKELQAREDARRLLIVCPAMLRDKWVGDLRERFNLYAEVIDAKGLLEKTQLFLSTGNPDSFIYVASLEGLRTKNWDEKNSEQNLSSRTQLAQLLEVNPATNDLALFDLVIIDEAHYLRNPETANHKFSQLLREASRHLLLLTATPIQIRSDNLYQLLKLISPEDFFDPTTFERMLEANRPLVEALQLMGQPAPDLKTIHQNVKQALESDNFSQSSRLQKLDEQLLEICGEITPDKQAKFAQVLESASLFGQFMTRSRKRDVIQNRVKRRPQTLDVKFTPSEQQVYEYVTDKIRQQARGQTKFVVFRLMVRQRQMASCMVAALEAWKEKGVLDDFLIIDDDNDDINDELLYEIYGSELDSNSKSYSSSQLEKVAENIPTNPFPDNDSELKQFIEQLKKVDSKYNKLRECIREQLQKNPKEKFVLFSFYRKSLAYLQKRFAADKIQTCLIQGGMNREEKQEILQQFQNNSKISILLSSEVGSEGIDLQFCRFIINYDLPWNPMRVEQRIGRLDRLNQKFPVISIINFSIKDTIEEYILERLYDRINIFKESIGDLEEILGEKTEDLILEILNPGLSEEELKKQAEQTILALANEMDGQRRLEDEAMNLVAFSDYLLNVVNQSRQQGKWLRPEELQAFVEDFFKLQYPGTVIEPVQKVEGLFNIRLASEAQVNLKLFCTQKRLSTLLCSTRVSCFFDPKIAGTMGQPNHELLDPNHPLIQWICHQYEDENSSLKFQPVSAIQIPSIKPEVKTGYYVYVIHRWNLQGIREKTRLAYRIMSLEQRQILPDEIAELIINQAALIGKPLDNVANLIALHEVVEVYEECTNDLQIAFAEAEAEFEADNTDWCNRQEATVKAYAQRKQGEFEERIAGFQDDQKKRSIIPAIQGQINKVNQNLNLALKRINEKRKITASNPELAAGLIFVEELKNG
ncbi:MAG: SNF2-related protein [Lyngbya sp.]|nr:SNF2-related protein [Lyngbya sp.]